jgi:hypothetical protein
MTVERAMRAVARFKLADKLAALNDLGRHLGIFNNKLELKGKLTLEQLVLASFKKDEPIGDA